MILDKSGILAQRLPTESVVVDWLPDKPSIVVRALPIHVMLRAAEKKDLGDAYIFVNAVVNESGDRLFADKDEQDIADRVDSNIMRLVVAAAYRLSQVPEDRKEAIKKNWLTPQTEDSGE